MKHKWDINEKHTTELDFYFLLYPQYKHDFDKVITENTWRWLQEGANEMLQESITGRGEYTSEMVEHLKSIINGKVPFGYRVSSIPFGYEVDSK